MMNRVPLFLLYFNVLVIATCGLIYELLAGTLASYLLGDSVRQFSLIIGGYLSALGVGAWLSKYLEAGLARCFIEVELGVALVGGLSTPILFLSFAQLEWFPLVLYSLVFAIGVLVGLELPLLMRIMKSHLDFSDLVSRTLTFDYIGALLASLAFPLFFIPYLGLVRTSLVFGMLNAMVALWGTYVLRPILSERGLGRLRFRATLVLVILGSAFIKADDLTRLGEEGSFSHPIVHAQTTPFQRIVITRGRNSFQLHLNGNLQFNSADEYRYHEALVHPALSLVDAPSKVLVLGGGDGLAVREILKYPQISEVTLVDIDPAITQLAKSFNLLKELNGNCFADPRVTTIHQDAFIWLEGNVGTFDAVVIDFPDPSTFSLGKLYTTRFYRSLRKCLAADAFVAIQSTSPLVAPKSFWCVVRTLEEAGFIVHPYQVTVPSFGIWGFVLAHSEPFSPPQSIAPHLLESSRFLGDSELQAMFQFPRDLKRVKTDVNRLDNQLLVQYYAEEWGAWNR